MGSCGLTAFSIDYPEVYKVGHIQRIDLHFLKILMELPIALEQDLKQ